MYGINIKKEFAYLAMWLHPLVQVPALVKDPPAYTLLPEIAMAFTLSFIPELMPDQVLPSHFAMRAHPVVQLMALEK